MKKEIAADTSTSTRSPVDEWKQYAYSGSSHWAAIGIFVLLCIAGLAYARVFLVPVILAFLLSLVFSPIRRKFQRMGIPDGLAAGAIVLGLVVGLFTIGYLLTAPVQEWFANAPTIGDRLEQRIRDIRSSIVADSEDESLREVVEQVENATAVTSDDDATEVVVKEQGYLSLLAESIPSMVVQTVLVLILLFFILASGDMFYEKLVHVMPTFRDKRRAVQIAHDIERKLSQYLMAITIINTGLGVAVGLAMWALGMPNPLMFGVAACLLNYVPYIGAIGGSLLALLVGLLTFDTLVGSLIPAAAYYTLTALEGQIVTPYFVGRQLKLNTVVVFISVTFWAWLWSVIGMLIAVPMLVTLRTLCEHIPQLEPYGDFLSARGAEEQNEVADEPQRKPARATTGSPTSYFRSLVRRISG